MEIYFRVVAAGLGYYKQNPCCDQSSRDLQCTRRVKSVTDMIRSSRVLRKSFSGRRVLVIINDYGENNWAEVRR